MTLTRPLIRFLSEARAFERRSVTIDGETRFANALYRTFVAQRQALERDTRARGWTGTLTEAHPLSARQWEPYLLRLLMGVQQDQRAAVQKYGLRALSSGVRRFTLDVGVGIAFDLDDPRAVNWMRTHGADLVTRISETTRDRIGRVLTRATEDGLSWRELTNDLRSSFGFSYKRAKMIARTETANAFAEGNLVGARKLHDAGIRTEKAWLTNEPEDQACIGNGEIEWIEIEDAFPSGHMRPPAHPNCECDLVFRTVEIDKKKTVVAQVVSVPATDDDGGAFYEYQDAEMESIPKAIQQRDVGKSLEDAMDIGRGISTKAHHNYIDEKIDAVAQWIDPSEDFRNERLLRPLKDGDAALIAELERKYGALTNLGPAQTAVRDITLAIARQDLPAARAALSRLRLVTNVSALTDQVKADLVPDIPDEAFAGQAEQFPAKGPPGLTYVKGPIDDKRHVDVLLQRDKSGEIVGILYHYPFDMPPYEKKGNVNLLVRPDSRRQGIGTALLKDAMKRWKIDLAQQQQTRAGAALTRALAKNKADFEAEFAPLPRLPKAGDADERPALEDRLRERDRQSIVKAMGAPTFPDRKVGVWRTDDPFLAGYGALGKEGDKYGFYAEMKLRGYQVRLVKDVIVVFPQRYKDWNDPELADLRTRLEKRRAGSQVRWEIFKAAGYDAPHIRELERLRKLGAVKTGPRVKPNIPTPFVPFVPIAPDEPLVPYPTPEPIRDAFEAFDWPKRKIDPSPAFKTRGEAETWLSKTFHIDAKYGRDAESEIAETATMTAYTAGLQELDRLAKLFPKVAASLAAVSTRPGARAFEQTAFGTGEIAAVTRSANPNLAFQIMNMNPKYWANPRVFQAAVDRAVDSGFFPPGNNNFASNVTHEWGHVIDNFLVWHADDNVLDEHGVMSTKTVFDISAKYMSQIKDLSNAYEISRYASQGGSPEAFAEAFRSLSWTPTSKLSPQALALRKMLSVLEKAGVFK